jgi:hypothetical protein
MQIDTLGARGGTYRLDSLVESVITSGPDMMAAEEPGQTSRGRKTLASSRPSSSKSAAAPSPSRGGGRKPQPKSHWTSDSLPAVDARMQLPARVLATSKDLVAGDALILGVGAGAFAVQVLKVRAAIKSCES